MYILPGPMLPPYSPYPPYPYPHPHPHQCPGCGRCPTCGRRRYWTSPWQIARGNTTFDPFGAIRTVTGALSA